MLAEIMPLKYCRFIVKFYKKIFNKFNFLNKMSGSLRRLPLVVNGFEELGPCYIELI